MANRKSFAKNALCISFGAFAVKIIGAVYRVPLTNIIGSTGIGLYQTVFPFYAMLLTISSTGIPNSLSKQVAEYSRQGKDEEILLLKKTSLLLFGVIGIIGVLLMCALSGVLASFQGEIRAKTLYIVLSPSVFFVSLISCYRGFFQGGLNMKPTVYSQLIEQTIKLLVGLSLCFLLMPDVGSAAMAAAFAVTISEISAWIYLKLHYGKKHAERNRIRINKNTFFKYGKVLLSLSIPVTLSALALPLSQLIDSFMIINIISEYSSEATSLYGLYSGAVGSIIGVPVAVAYGAAVSVVPLISGAIAVKDEKDEKKKIFHACLLTFAVSVPSAIATYLLSDKISSLLYSSLGTEKCQTIANLLKISSFSVIFLSFLQTLSAILVGKGKAKFSVYAIFSGIIVKTIIEFFLLKNPKINIYGAAISANVCYFVASFLILVYIISGFKKAVYVSVPTMDDTP